MTARGIVRNGVIIPDASIALPEGAEVIITSLAGETLEVLEPASLAEAMREFIGIGDDMPADGARNIEHYLYGARRK